jgi:hypothetical protein
MWLAGSLLTAQLTATRSPSLSALARRGSVFTGLRSLEREPMCSSAAEPSRAAMGREALSAGWVEGVPIGGPC